MLQELPTPSLSSRAEERATERVVLTFLKPRFCVALGPASKSLEVQVKADAPRPNLLWLRPA